jgi:hypothetical protein
VKKLIYVIALAFGSSAFATEAADMHSCYFFSKVHPEVSIKSYFGKLGEKPTLVAVVEGKEVYASVWMDCDMCAWGEENVIQVIVKDRKTSSSHSVEALLNSGVTYDDDQIRVSCKP